jgi:hypothetical protein
MKPEASLLCSQEPTTYPSSYPGESIPTHPISLRNDTNKVQVQIGTYFFPRRLDYNQNICDVLLLYNSC